MKQHFLNYKNLLLLVFCILSQQSVHAQQKSTSEKQNDLLKLQLLKRNLEVFSQALPDSNYLSKVAIEVSADINTINSNTLLLDETSLKNLSVYELKYLETQQMNVIKDVEKYNEEAVELIEEMQTYKQEIDTLYATLQDISRDSLARELDALDNSNALNISKDSFLYLFDVVYKRIERSKSEVDDILNNLNYETQLLKELKTIQTRNLVKIEEMVEGKLGIKSSPIWEISRKDNFTKNTLDNLKSSIDKISLYISKYQWRFYVHILCYFIILGIALYFKRQQKLWERYNKRSDEIVHVLHPLRNPQTASFLLTLSLTSWVHYGAPGDFFDVVLILLPLPILVFIYRFKLYALFKETAIFSSIFVLVHFQHFIVFNSLFHRLALIVFASLMVYSIRRIQKNYQGEYLKTFKYLFRVASYALYLSILGNVIGYFEFSQFIINRVSAAIVLAALFHISSFVITDILKLFLLSNRLQQFKSIKKNYPTIKSSLQRIVKIIAVFAWLIVVLKNSGFYVEVTEPFKKLLFTERSIGSVTYTISGLVLFVVTIYLSTKLSRILEEIFKEDLGREGSVQKRNVGALTILVRYGVITIGLLMAVAFSGLPVENITIIIGALGVGIGFGLQNIFNNLVSGFILAVEKPIQIGDIVQIDDLMGEVQDIGIRASKVRVFEGSEVIIPNGDLISKNVINWTHSDRMRRIEIFVGVAYGTDTEKVIELLKEAVSKCEVVREEPRPIVVFHNFGDSSLVFRVLCWTSIDDFLTGRSDLSMTIDKLFKTNDITIPFPQRDLYIKSVDKFQIDTKEKGSE